MDKLRRYIRDGSLTVGLLSASFFLCLALQDVFDTRTYVPTVFVFAVFLISLLTDGYLYGTLAAFAAVIAVNYAFTFPYFKLNFTIPENLFSAGIMIAIALLTGALTTKVKHQEVIRTQAETERMRANLLRAVSHDLRTPLTTIYGSSSALLENGNSFTSDQQTQMLTGIREDAQWLMRMVENLLSITRIDSGGMKLLKVPVVLEELIDSVLVKFSKRYPNQQVNLSIPEEILVIPMDAILVEQVLLNMLENAVQHAAGMTELSLRVFALGGQAIFEIQDNGCGIDKTRLDSIFSGYSKSANMPADGQKGNAGIGLSVCATIIKAHGGSIRAENAKGGGAVFRFCLDTEDSDEQ